MTEQTDTEATIHFVDIDDDAVTVDGTEISVGGDPHAEAVHHLARKHAQRLGHAVQVIATDMNGHMRISVNPDGSTSNVTPISEEEARELQRLHRPKALHVINDAAGDEPDAEPTPSSPWATTAISAQTPIHVAPDAPRHARKSFLSAEPIAQPARQGWRGALNRAGLRLDPGATELEWRQDVQAVSQHWPGARTIAIANEKGGSGKTPTAVMISAVFARYGGAGILAWDNNETRGSMDKRTQHANHESTVVDMLPRVEHLLSPSASAADLATYTHHQPTDKFDVLHSDTALLGQHQMTGQDVHAIHRATSRYYRLLVMDSGNNREAGNWLAMLELADSLVIPCTDVEDSAETGALIIDALHAQATTHGLSLAKNAVAIVSQKTDSKEGRAEAQRIREGWTGLVREVVPIPYDPALRSGIIHFDALQARTQRAWLRAAAAVARGL